MIAGGILVAVVGPSGAGKDTLIAHARRTLEAEGRADILFVRRTVTRASDPAGEDHDTLDKPAFDAAEKAGAFAVSWAAHGLRYGLPADLDAAIAQGRVAVANVSRAAVPALRLRYANVTVVSVTADPAILADRIAGRGRESGSAVLARIARAASPTPEGAVVIDNSGSIAEGAGRLIAVIREAAARAAPALRRA